MQSIIDARAELATHTRAAKNMLAEMGARHWAPRDQATFDGLMDKADAARERLDAGLLASGETFTVRAHHREALDLFLRKSANAMSAAERSAVRNTMSTTINTQGGYAVHRFVAAQMVDFVKSYGFMRQVAEQITTTDGADGVIPGSDGTAEIGELLAQNVAASSSDPTFVGAAVPTYRFGSKVIAVPVELTQDSAVDIVGFVMKRCRDRIGRAQNAYFTTGSGVAQPTGLVTAAGVGKVGPAGQVVTVTYDDLVDLEDSVDTAHLGMPEKDAAPSAVEPGWMFSQTTRRVIRRLKDTTGRPLWMPSYDHGVPGGLPDRLMGYPVYINNDMPAPAANAKTVAFGNFKGYVIRDALDMVLHRFDDSAYNKLGQVGFLAVLRSGGNLADTGAVKVYQHSAT